MIHAIQGWVAHQGMTLTSACQGRSDKEVASQQQTYSQQTHQATQMHSSEAQGLTLVSQARVLASSLSLSYSSAPRECCKVVFPHTLWKKLLCR